MMNIEDVRTVPIGPYSAYAIAVKYGFVGTEAEWLASLTGPRGEKGDRGEKGEDGSILSTSAIQQMIDDVISAEHEKLRFWASPDPTSPASLFGGTWERIAQDRALMGASDNHAAGTTAEAGLPNITGSVTYVASGYGAANSTMTGAFGCTGYYSNGETGYTSNGSGGTLIEDFNIDASRSSSIYGSSTTVQPPAYYLYLWKRVG